MSGLSHEDLYERVKEDIERERGPLAWLRARPTPVRAAIVFSTAAVSVALGLMIVGFSHLSAPSIAPLAALGVILVLALGVCLRPIYRRALGAWARRIAVGGLVLGALTVMALDANGVGSLGSGGCLVPGAIAATPVFVVILLVTRRPRTGVVFGGLAAGVVGAITVQVFCGGAGLLHAATEHFGLILAFTTIAWLARLALTRATTARGPATPGG